MVKWGLGHISTTIMICPVQRYCFEKTGMLHGFQRYADANYF